MYDYYIRTTYDLWSTVIVLGELLGVISVDEEGNVHATDGGAWDYIGEIQETISMGDETISMPLTDEEGNIYIHGNLRTTTNLRERALSLAESNPELASVLNNLSQFFLLDENGNARLPENPYRVWA